MKAVIMAGGHGTRIRSVASDIPKPMIPVLGKPILEYQIENLRRCGITDIKLITGYLSECISDYFGDGSNFGVKISYFNEDRPMGTAGALYYLKKELDESFLLLMGDLMLSVDFDRFMSCHNESGAAVTLFVHPNSHPYDSDIIVTDEVKNVNDFTEDKCGINASFSDENAVLSRPVTGFISKKAERTFFYHNQVNSGIYAISPKVLNSIPEPIEGKVDLDKDIIHKMIDKGSVYAYSSSEYVKDMGTPERYDEVTRAVESGLYEKRNLSNRQKCVFMDRDGTLNVEKGFINAPEAIELLPKAAEAVRTLNSSEYLAVVITNQPVVARGEADFESLDEIQKALDTRLGECGAYIDGAYFCPHHTDRGFDGEVRELKFKCGCRKPEPGMILKAAAEHNIDLKGSWMIGDSTADILCGQKLGLKTIGVLTGNALKDGKYDVHPDFIAADMEEAVNIILNADEQ